VETEAQVGFVGEQNCEEVQGLLFGSHTSFTEAHLLLMVQLLAR
jgi:EAL domain-containing protein (putative c-di-GMP-specific phosphodiesterase class I)